MKYDRHEENATWVVSVVNVLDVNIVQKNVIQSLVSRRDGLVIEPVINLCSNFHKHPEGESHLIKPPLYKTAQG